MLIINVPVKGKKNPHKIIKVINMDKKGNCKTTKIDAKDLKKKLSEYAEEKERKTIND